jgi:hypothetical protein
MYLTNSKLRLFLEAVHLVKQLPVFYETLRFFAMFRTVGRSSLFSTKMCAYQQLNGN